MPAALDDLILRCLAKSPTDRPASAEELIDRLRTIEVGGTWTAERAAEWWEEHRPTARGRAGTPDGRLTDQEP